MREFLPCFNGWTCQKRTFGLYCSEECECIYYMWLDWQEAESETQGVRNQKLLADIDELIGKHSPAI